MKAYAPGGNTYTRLALYTLCQGQKICCVRICFAKTIDDHASQDLMLKQALLLPPQERSFCPWHYKSDVSIRFYRSTMISILASLGKCTYTLLFSLSHLRNLLHYILYPLECVLSIALACGDLLKIYTLMQCFLNVSQCLSLISHWR